MPTLYRYLAGSVVYGTFHAIARMHESRITRTDDRGKSRPPLLATKAAITACCALVAPCYLPIYLVHDVNRMEIALRGDSPSRHGYPAHSDVFSSDVDLLFSVLYN